MVVVFVRYYKSYGQCGGSEHMDFEAELTPEEQEIYDTAIRKIKQEIYDSEDPEDVEGIGVDDIELDDLSLEELREIPELAKALKRTEIEIIEYELSEGFGEDDENEEYRNALGYNKMDVEKLEALVRQRDSYTLKYFGLENASDEDLEKWTCDDPPMERDFVVDFKPRTGVFSVYYAVEDTF